jgi:non-ribosomal peptide synthetase component F
MNTDFFALITDNARAYPDRIAIVSGDESITYGELITAAESCKNSIGGSRRIVPVTAPAGIDWFTRVFGIMAAGLAAVPISGAVPPERADFILRDTGDSAGLPDDAVLIYYTSGSTGSPKGVILTHGNIISFSKTHAKLFFDETIKNAAVVADPSFDAFLLSSFPALMQGLTLYIAPEEVRTSLVSLHKYLIKNRIDITFLTTQLALSYMRAFDNKYLKTLLTGGEALRGYVPRGYKVYNLYGPCEATVYVTAHCLTEADAANPSDIPIGKPTGENRIMIIDGEISISGEQLSAGYLNRPEETAARFTANPDYRADTDDLSYRFIYKTGDRAELRADGELLYRGRTDSQIKISGYRIEIGEIEAKIMSCEGISGVKVNALIDDNGERYLNAVCVGNSDEQKLRRELERILPRAMIPAKISFIERIKIDPRTGKGVMV